MKNAEINRLGEALRNGHVTSEYLIALDEYRRSFQPAIEEVAQRLLFLSDGAIVQRPSKSTPSIISKLKRQPTIKLMQIQDIAGLRILVESSFGQGNLVGAVKIEFPNAKLYDRIHKPSFGYRAVHLVVACMDRPIEIQIRTTLQHAWAHLSERLADAHGHEIKYGGGVLKFQQQLISLSDEIADLESDERSFNASAEFADDEVHAVELEKRREALLDRISTISI